MEDRSRLLEFVQIYPIYVEVLELCDAITLQILSRTCTTFYNCPVLLRILKKKKEFPARKWLEDNYFSVTSEKIYDILYLWACVEKEAKKDVIKNYSKYGVQKWYTEQYRGWRNMAFKTIKIKNCEGFVSVIANSLIIYRTKSLKKTETYKIKLFSSYILPDLDIPFNDLIFCTDDPEAHILMKMRKLDEGIEITVRPRLCLLPNNNVITINNGSIGLALEPPFYPPSKDLVNDFIPPQ